MTILTLDPWIQGSIEPKLELELERTCEYKYCNSNFKCRKNGGNPHRFCSRSCARRQRNNIIPHKLIENTCENCGDKFRSVRKKRSCSKSCYQREYRKNPGVMEQLRRYARIFSKTEKCRVYHRERHKMNRLQIMYHLGGVICIDCSCQDYDKLQLDHINGDGTQDRTKFLGSAKEMVWYYVKHLDEAKQKLQVRCLSCNNAKNRKYTINAHTMQEIKIEQPA